MYTSKDGMRIGNSWEELGINVPAGRTGNYKTTCPVCSSSRKSQNQKDPCLSIMIDDKYAKCHNCGSEFLIDKNGYTTGVSKREYAEPTQRSSYDLASSDVVKFFSDRCISEDTLRKMKVTSGHDWMPQTQSKVETIHFNYHDREKLINIKYRGRGKHFRMFKDAKLIFYNLNALYNADDYIIITEGEIDAMSYIEAGLSNVVSVPNGASKGSMNLEYLNNHFFLFENDNRKKLRLKPIKKIYIATDDDDAGFALRKEMVRRFGADRCWFVDLQGCNDPNELLQKKGKVALYNSWDKAKPAPLDDVKTVWDLKGELKKLKADGLKPGVQVGSENFKQLYSFEQPRMTIITGVSTHGKSEFLDDILARLSVFEGWRFALFSPENFPIEYHISKLVSKITGKEFNEVSGIELEECYNFIAEHFFWIYPEDDNYTLENILRISDLLVARYGINGLIIDPWTEIDKQGQTGTEDINKWLSLMTRYKRNKNVHMFLVAHPTKMGKDESGDVLVPTLMDIAGSGHFYNKTDGGITVYRSFKTNSVTIHVNKVKFKHLGRIGETEMQYNVRNGRYQDTEDVNRNGWDDNNWLHLGEEEQIAANFDFEQQKPPSEHVFDRDGEDDMPF